MRLLRLALCLVVLGCAAPLFAQQNLVEQAKRELAAAGFQVENKACSDFEIAKVVAGRLRAQGAGLLTKSCCGDGNDPNRTHCEFQGEWYAHDVVAFPDGTIVDIAQDGGGANGPRYDVAPADPGLIGRYRSAVSLGLTGQVPGSAGPAPVPVTPPVAVDPVDVRPLLDRISVLEQSLGNLKNMLEQLVGGLQAEQADRANRDTDLSHQLEALKARPMPTGCTVTYLRCRLTP